MATSAQELQAFLAQVQPGLTLAVAHSHLGTDFPTGIEVGLQLHSNRVASLHQIVKNMVGYLFVEID